MHMADRKIVHSSRRARPELQIGFVALLAALLLVGATGAASAQVWPAKAIRFIVPYSPGAGTDIVARMVAARLTDTLGQPVLVDNKPGASALIGTEILAKAVPDGYTIGLITDSHAINPHFFPKLPYDSLRDFEPVSQLVFSPMLLVAHPALRVRTVQDLVAAARARPGKINYASIGNGTPHHLGMEWLKNILNIDLTHVPYKGVAPAVTDVVAGQVDLMFTGISGLANVKAGKLVGIGMASARRQAIAPDIPTLAESGLPGFNLMVWYGIAAPSGTPRDIIARLNRDVARALGHTDVRSRLAAMGAEGAPSTPEEFSAFMHREAVKYENIIRITGARGG